MAHIRIIQAHRLTHEKARAAAQTVADQLAQEFDTASEWDGDVLQFERSGVTGTLTLSAQQAHLEINLDSLFLLFAPAIEQKAASKMRKIFTGAG
jgi:putative polyhydroxyalkanoate system protein